MTFLKPVDVPAGYSPALSNVRFFPRAVTTRPGLTARISTGGPYNGLGQFLFNLQKTLIVMDSSGSVSFADPNIPTQPDLLQQDAAADNSFMQPHEKFGRMFMAFYNADLSPAGPVRYWNGIRQLVAPQAPLPTIHVVDSAVVDANWAAGANIYFVQVLYETSDGCFLVASQLAEWTSVGGLQPVITLLPLPVGPTTFNVIARWIAFSIPVPRVGPIIYGGQTLFRIPSGRVADNVSTTATIPGVAAGPGIYAPIDELVVGKVNQPCLAHIAPDGPGAAPTAQDSAVATVLGMAVGVHQVQVIYETIFGFLSFPSPAASWTASGSFQALITNIPTGPWYVIARRLLFTSAGGANFFYVSQFRIPNNTTTSVLIDFNDTQLLQGSNFDYLTRNFAVPPAMGVSSYGGRLCVWSCLNTVKFNNAGFDGGWSAADGSPLGWILDAGFGAGGSREQFNAYAGDAWRITGDGATAQRGMITNSAIGAALALNTAYTVSVRIRADAAMVAGSLTVELFSGTLGSLGLFNVTNPQLKTRWEEYTGLLTVGLSNIPLDLVLRVYADNKPTNNARIWADHIQIYPMNNPTESSLLRVSNPFDPETFDSISGFEYVEKDNGERITAVLQLRAFLYVLKERSMHVTYDDTINPPSLWLIRRLDSTIGNASPRSAVSSDTFITFAGRGGAYLFTGSRPQKVSQEIQTTWRTINWGKSGIIHTVLDPEAKVVLFFVPIAGDASRNAFVLDYSEGIGQEDDPGPRKWGLDFYPSAINASLKFETNSVDHPGAANEQAIYLAGAKVYENAGTDDDGTPIDSFYETAFLKAGEQGGQDLFGGVSFIIEGAGQFTTTLVGLDGVLMTALQNRTLTANPGKQFELYANMETERAKIRFETNSPGTFYTLKSVTLYGIPWSAQRPN